jgi:hypothetical protein
MRRHLLFGTQETQNIRIRTMLTMYGKGLPITLVHHVGTTNELKKREIH